MNARFHTWFFLLAAQFGALPAYAQQHAAAGEEPCQAAVRVATGDDANLKDGTQVLASACKAWPGLPSRTIVALAYDAGVAYQKALVVALVDVKQSALVARYDGVIEEDAALTVGPGSLRIDTARYQLAPGVRAFGLDLSTGYSQGCVEGGYGPTRTLYVQEGRRLRPVLEGLPLSAWRYLRGGPSCAEEDDALIETTVTGIAIGKAVDHGFSSLRVSTARFVGDKPKRHDRSRSIDVHYDGTRYRMPGIEELQ